MRNHPVPCAATPLVGLRKFSYLLLQVAIALMVIILASNLLLQKPLIDSVLFSLAIAAVGQGEGTRQAFGGDAPPASTT